MDAFDTFETRDGYVATPAAYAPKKASQPVSKSHSRLEERLGSLIAAAGIVWAVHEGTKDLVALWQLKILPPGPLEVCAIGVLIWLHAKWRHAVRAR